MQWVCAGAAALPFRGRDDVDLYQPIDTLVRPLPRWFGRVAAKDLLKIRHAVYFGAAMHLCFAVGGGHARFRFALFEMAGQALRHL